MRGKFKNNTSLMYQIHFIFLIYLCLVGIYNVGTGSDLASQQLLSIAEKEAGIYKKIADDPEFYSEEDLERRINELLQSYRTYLHDQPSDVSAYILYGKLLRRVNENEQAFNAFLKADELDPTIAVVKQQIGNHLAEKGKGKAALSFFLQAVDLAPNVPIYHFSLGQIIYDFRNEFISNGIFTRDTLEREMLEAFSKAAKLAPSNFDYQMRMGEAYYDLASPDWKSALIHWNKLREGATTLLQNEILDLHRARTLGKLGRSNEAKVLLVNVRNMALQRSKAQVINEISQH